MPDVHLHYYDDQWASDPDGLNFLGHHTAETGDTSALVKRAWVRYGSAWGGVTADGAAGLRIVALDVAARPIGENDRARDYWELPPGTRQFTVEGRRERSVTQVSVMLLQEAK